MGGLEPPAPGPLPADWFEPAPRPPADLMPPALAGPPSPSPAREAWRRFRRNTVAVPGLVGLALIVGAVVIGPHLASAPYDRIDLLRQNEPPSPGHWFGTDALGRDTFARTWMAGRVSLLVGLAAAVIDLTVGALYGGVAGLVGGRVDEVMMRAVDVLYGVPFLLVAILLLLVMGPGPRSVVAAIALVNWLGMARLVRGQVLQLKEREYVLAARALGVPRWRILLRHLLPNAAGPMLVWLSYNIPAAIFAEALLSYVGLGVRPPVASWGSMISSGGELFRIHPSQFLFPAGALSLTMLSLYAVGDGLRDALDPRLPPGLRPPRQGRSRPRGGGGGTARRV